MGAAVKGTLKAVGSDGFKEDRQAGFPYQPESSTLLSLLGRGKHSHLSQLII